MKKMKTKMIILLAVVTFTLCACSSTDNIATNAKNIVEEDISEDISVNKCLYNKEANASYLNFYSTNHGEDEAIILFNDDSIFYESVYSAIDNNDYDKIIEYGDYTTMMYQINVNGTCNDWVEVELSK